MVWTGVDAGASSTGDGVAFGLIGGVVATAGGGAAFFFDGTVAGELSSVTSALDTGFCASGEAGCSVSAVAGCCSVALGVAIDPGGHVIQHSAAAGSVRIANPLNTVKLARKREVALIVRPPLLLLYSTPLCGRVSSLGAAPMSGSDYTLRG